MSVSQVIFSYPRKFEVHNITLSERDFQSNSQEMSPQPIDIKLTNNQKVKLTKQIKMIRIKNND